jgi:hypothetical protein
MATNLSIDPELVEQALKSVPPSMAIELYVFREW